MSSAALASLVIVLLAFVGLVGFYMGRRTYQPQQDKYYFGEIDDNERPPVILVVWMYLIMLLYRF